MSSTEPSRSPHPGSSPGETFPEHDLMQELTATVTSQQAVFCCGGTIPVATGRDHTHDHVTADKERLVSPPVVIRWDVPSGKAIRKLTLPVEQGAKGTPAISALVKDCSPATFGRRGEEVLDESYREAAKLESHQFCTSFSPHDCGIIDAIAQTILPEVANPCSAGQTAFQEHWGIVAELYKLNVGLTVLQLLAVPAF
jgi:hypothetical protein